ncbi:MAG: bile acid:sodium symporter, partial [Candidatus Altiarchaeota archaeon]
DFGILFQPYVIHCIAFMLFLSCLKIDYGDVLHHLKNPMLIGYLTLTQLIAVPLILFYTTSVISQELAVAVLILTAIPAAMAGPTLTDLSKGNVSLALVITTFTSLLCPFTIPLVMHYALGENLTVSAESMMLSLAKIIFLPFAAAVVVRNAAKKQIEETKRYYSGVTIILLMPIVMAPLAKYSTQIFQNLGEIIVFTIYMFLISAALHTIGWARIYWLRREDKIASSVSSAYNNLSLAIVFSTQYFNPKITLAVIAYELPWNLMLIPFKKSHQKTYIA